MIDWTTFECVFPSKTDYSLDHKQIDTIVRNRKGLGGTLFFDRIWNSVGLKQPQKSYPPKSNAELRSLWQKVAKSDVSDEKKQAILFYVLKDCQQAGNIESLFAQKVHLPLKYVTLVVGLWELDHLQFSRALEYLCDSSLTSEFADEILLTLLTTPQCEKSLATAYYLTVQPPMTNQETLHKYFQLLVHIDVVEAYRFSAKKEKSNHKILFEELLRSVLDQSPSLEKANRTRTLLSLPFTEDESAWFEEYLLHGNNSKIAAFKDSVILRRLVTGRTITGVGILDRHRGQKIDDVNWDDIRKFANPALA